MESAGEILTRPQRLKRRVKAAAPLTRSQEKLVDAAVVIRMNPGDTEAAFMARELVQCTLPHSNPGDKLPAWTRRNGTLMLTIQPGWDAQKNASEGYPYGSIPRLLLFWLTTEAVRTKSRRLELGNSLAEFMREVGLDPSHGGKKSAAYSLKKQIRRLFRCRISFEQRVIDGSREGEGWLDMQVGPKAQLWWDAKQPNQGTLWGSWVELGEDFFKAIIASPVPVDMRVLREVKQSPLALDLYAWATWRVFKLQRAAFIPWDGLMKQMGAEYKDTKEFTRYGKAAFRKIRAVYPALKLDYAKGGFVLHPSLTAIAPAPKRA